MTNLNLEYFTGEEVEQFPFLRLPKLFFSDPRLKVLSTDSKVLYACMLDRVSLSTENGWKDKDGRVYIIYTSDEASKFLGKSNATITKIMAELDSVKGLGLIERKKQGLGKPDLIYVKNFSTLVEKKEGATPLETSSPEPRKLNLRDEEITSLDPQKLNAIKTNQTKTDFIKTEQSTPPQPPQKKNMTR